VFAFFYGLDGGQFDGGRKILDYEFRFERYFFGKEGPTTRNDFMIMIFPFLLIKLLQFSSGFPPKILIQVVWCSKYEMDDKINKNFKDHFR